MNIDKLIELAKKATPGPWEFEEWPGAIYADRGDTFVCEVLVNRDGHFITLANPATVLELCEEVKKLHNVINNAVEKLKESESIDYSDYYNVLDKPFVLEKIIKEVLTDLTSLDEAKWHEVKP